MSENLEITRLAFVILAKSHSPTLLNPDFLIRKNIIDEDWKVDSYTFTTEKLSQVVYQNGIIINVNFDQIYFQQNIEETFSQDEILIDDIIIKYLDVLPHVNYTGIVINIVGHILFDSNTEVENYLSNSIFRPGDWKKFLDQQPTMSANLIYKFQDHQISVSVESVQVSKTNEDAAVKKPAILFNCHIQRDFKEYNNNDERLKMIKDRVTDWDIDVNNLIQLINQFVINKD